jgi:hypothetical protein
LSLTDNIPYCSWPSLCWQLQHMQAHMPSHRYARLQNYTSSKNSLILQHKKQTRQESRSQDLVWDLKYKWATWPHPRPVSFACIISFFIISHRPPHQKEILSSFCGIKFQIESLLM